jgi:hypothetical protein
MATTIFEEMVSKWPSSIVSRCEISNFSGGMIKAKYAANLDSAGLGCPGRFRIGRKVCYPTNNLARWLADRSTSIPLRRACSASEKEVSE